MKSDLKKPKKSNSVTWGYVVLESGCAKIRKPLVLKNNTIGLGVARDHRLEGRQLDVLEYLRKHGERVVSTHSQHGDEKNRPTVKVRTGRIAKSAAEVIQTTFLSAGLSMFAVNALTDIPVEDLRNTASRCLRLNKVTPKMKGPACLTGFVNRMIDGERIFVELTYEAPPDRGKASKIIDTGKSQITYAELSYVLQHGKMPQTEACSENTNVKQQTTMHCGYAA